MQSLKTYWVRGKIGEKFSQKKATEDCLIALENRLSGGPCARIFPVFKFVEIDGDVIGKERTLVLTRMEHDCVYIVYMQPQQD